MKIPSPDKIKELARFRNTKDFMRRLRSVLLGKLDWKLPDHVWSRDGKKKGKTTGAWYHCRLEGCCGFRVKVVWPGGRSTWPCTEGLTTKKGRCQIS